MDKIVRFHDNPSTGGQQEDATRLICLLLIGQHIKLLWC